MPNQLAWNTNVSCNRVRLQELFGRLDSYRPPKTDRPEPLARAGNADTELSLREFGADTLDALKQLLHVC